MKFPFEKNGYIYVIGDYINDYTRICKPTRLCPEAPVPVLVQEKVYTTAGGAGLVAAQLREWFGDTVQTAFVSTSRKERIFAGNHLVARVDFDSLSVSGWDDEYADGLVRDINNAAAVVVADYGKGRTHVGDARERLIIDTAAKRDIPVFVDAKNRWFIYRGATAMFPNEHEGHETMPACTNYTIQKLGARGCAINGSLVPAIPERHVVDTTGAGDIFLAAFVAKYMTWANASNDPWHGQLHEAARFANFVAGHSVEYVGTHVVKGIKLDDNF